MTRQTRLTLMLFPFGAGAAAVNLFFASLIFSWVGLPVLPPIWAVVGGILMGWPPTWYFARHIGGLMDRAEAKT